MRKGETAITTLLNLLELPQRANCLPFLCLFSLPPSRITCQTETDETKMRPRPNADLAAEFLRLGRADILVGMEEQQSFQFAKDSLSRGPNG